MSEQNSQNDYLHLLPVGAIIMWSGTEEQFSVIEQDGWRMCNGQGEGIPDLRGKFIVGADAFNANDSIETAYQSYVVGEEGDADRMPNHKHKISGEDNRKPLQENHHATKYFTLPIEANATEYHTNNVVVEEDYKPYENRPPYHALFYIIKVQIETE